MNRTAALGVCLLAATAAPAWAEDPPKKLTRLDRFLLEQKAGFLDGVGTAAFRGGKYVEAEKVFRSALDIARQVYPAEEFPKGHRAIATCLTNVGVVLEAQGRLSEAEQLNREALAVSRRLYDGPHADVARDLNNVAYALQRRGRLPEAEEFYRAALGMKRKLYKAAHPDLGLSLNNLAGVLATQGKLSEAEELYREALVVWKEVHPGDAQARVVGAASLAGVWRRQGRLADAEKPLREALEMSRRLFDGDHDYVLTSMAHLAVTLRDLGKLDEAEKLLADGLAMAKRLHRGDDPAVATAMTNLAHVHLDRGKPADAERLFRDALAMKKRLYADDQPEVAYGLHNLGLALEARGELAEAEGLFRDALAESGRLVAGYARTRSEGDALTLIAASPAYRDSYLSAVRARAVAPGAGYDPARAYDTAWAVKGALSRVYEQRHLAARAVTSPEAAALVGELTAARSRRAELLLARATADPETLKARDREFTDLDGKIAAATAALAARLPAVARADRLNAATAADLRKALPAGTALVDYHRYTFFEYDRTLPDGEKQKKTPRYMAFVVTRERAAWVDLGTAAAIDDAVAGWREAITGDAARTVRPAPAARVAELGGRVRGLVWDRVRKEIPPGTTTVYVCPDGALCRAPFAALPGDRPGTVLLEDFAVAAVPHAPFLLDQLWPRDPTRNPPAGVLVVGGVEYDAAPGPAAVAARAAPLIKPGDRPVWADLPATAGEAEGLAAAAGRKKLPVTLLGSGKATPGAVLAALPKARVAHLATHGFFADPSFRGPFRLDEREYQTAGWGERVGRAANSPLVMTGVVLAGANNPDAPGRGVLTGESLVDLDLGGLELAVLSACETGLGEVAGGEGVFGLQRALHYAGARDVVVSLWKVPDAPTAALMNLFYQNLWGRDLSPAEALRRAQLEVYRNPGKVADWAKEWRGNTFGVKKGSAAGDEPEPPPDGKAHPKVWAAFTLSGPGR